MTATAAAGYLLVYPLVLSIAQFLSDKINIERSRYSHHIASFAAAVAITYLLLSFLPDVYREGFTVLAYLPLVLGFVSIYLLEKLVYKRFPKRFSLRRLETYHDELHAGIIFLYHFAIGVVLISILANDMRRGLLFLPPLLMFTTIGNWSVHHHYLTKNNLLRLVLASSTLLGAISATVFTYPSALSKFILSLVAGILLFIIVREALPNEREGSPVLFIIGVIVYTAIILVSQ